MWGLWMKFYLIASAFCILALGPNWLEGVKIIGAITLFSLSRFAWAASKGPPKMLKVPSVILFFVGIAVTYTLSSVQMLINMSEKQESE